MAANPLVELAPFVLFFGVWFLTSDIYAATAALMLGLILQAAFTWWNQGRIDTRTRFIFLAGMAFGGATLLFRDETFIQWKPTIVNCCFSLAFVGSRFIGRKTLVERAIGAQFRLPRKVFNNLNWILACGFFIGGALNLIVAYNFSLEFWVLYKLWGGLLLTFSYLLAIILYLALGGYLKEEYLVKGTPETQAK